MDAIITEQLLIATLAEAIATKEDFYVKSKRGIPSVSQRLKNPGCMRSWKAPSGKKLPTVNGLVDFPHVNEGWRALRAQCKINVLRRRLTLRQFFAGKRGVYCGFAPRGLGHDPLAYAEFVQNFLERRLGSTVTLDTPVVLLIEASNGY